MGTQQRTRKIVASKIELQVLRGPEVWRPRRFVSYGLVFQALILRTISGCVAQSHLTGKQALRLYFAAQLIFLCEDVVFRAKPS